MLPQSNYRTSSRVFLSPLWGFSFSGVIPRAYALGFILWAASRRAKTEGEPQGEPAGGWRYHKT
jgi:hypothetical protein